MHYFEYTVCKTETDFKRCLLHAFKYFDGMTKEVLTDNMAAIVTCDGSTRTVHPTIEAFFKDLRVKLRLCKPRSPQTKGKVEVSNKFAQWLSSYNSKIESEEDLINKINRLNSKINKTLNQGTNRRPIDLFENEKDTLLELNKNMLNSWSNKYVHRAKVSSACLVYYKKARYSVSNLYVNKKVYIVDNGNTIEIYCDNILIATHPLSEKAYNYQESHYKEALATTINNQEKIDEISRKNLERINNVKL